MHTISLSELFEGNRKDEIFLLGKMKIPAERNYYTASFKLLNQGDDVYYTCVQHDYEKAKQCFYKAAIAETYRYENEQGDLFGVMDSFIYPLLSDNHALIERYMRYHQSPHGDAFNLHFGKAIQSFWFGDTASLAVHIEGLKKSGVKKVYLSLMPPQWKFLKDS